MLRRICKPGHCILHGYSCCSCCCCCYCMLHVRYMTANSKRQQQEQQQHTHTLHLLSHAPFVYVQLLRSFLIIDNCPDHRFLATCPSRWPLLPSAPTFHIFCANQSWGTARSFPPWPSNALKCFFVKTSYTLQFALNPTWLWPGIAPLGNGLRIHSLGQPESPLDTHPPPPSTVVYLPADCCSMSLLCVCVQILWPLRGN